MQNEERATKHTFKENLSVHSNRSLVISIIIMVTAVIFGAYRVVNLIQQGENFLNLPFVWFLIIIGGVCGYLSWKNRADAAGYILLGSLFLVSLTFVLRFQNAFTTLSGAILAVAIAITTLVLTNKNYIRNIIILFLILGALITFDQFGLPNRVVTSAAFAQIFGLMSLTGIGLLLIYLLYSFRSYPIRTKILISTIGISIFSVTLISISLFLFNRNRLIDEGTQNVQQIANSESLAFGELILQQIRIIESAALNPQLSQLAIESNNEYGDNSSETIIAQIEAIDRVWRVVSEDNEFVAPRLTNEQADNFRLLREVFPGNVEVFATDKFGALIASTNQTSDYYQADEDWWIQAYNDGNGAVFIGDPEFDSSADSFAVNIAVPILDQATSMADAEIVGILRTTFRLDRLNDILEATNATDQASSVNIYVNEDIAIVFQEDGQVVIQEPDLNTLGVVQNFADTNEAIQILDLDGQNFIASVAPVTTHERAPSILGLNWLVVVTQLESEVLASVAQQTQTVTILSIAALVLSALASVIVGNILVAPIQRLTEVAQRIEGGDRLARADIPETDDEIKNLSVALNSMTDELSTILNELETRVANRTRSLEIASNVSRELSSILDIDQLLASVVNLIRDTYDYYHAQIYLWNEDKTKLIMRQGTGNAGRELLTESFYISPNRGLVGQTAASGEPVFIPNVRDVNRPIAWIPNAKLPDTVSEIVVPIFLQNEVVGVLDVQDNELGKMTQDDVNTLQVVANQIGIAIQNARAYEDIQERAEQDNLLLSLGQKIQAADSIETLDKTAVSELSKYVSGQITINPNFEEPNGSVNGTGVMPIIGENGSDHEVAIGHFTISDPATLTSKEKELVWSVSQQYSDHAKILNLNNSIEAAYQETAKYSEQLRELNDLNTESNALSSAEDVLKLVTRRILEITGMNRVSITLIDQDDPEHLLIVQQEGETRDIGVGQKMPLKDSPMETAIFSGRIEEGVFGQENDQFSAKFIPLIALGEVIGTINVAHVNSDVFSERNDRLLNQIAISTSSILESKLLFERNQTTLKETESLYEIVSQLNTAVSAADVLNAITESPIAENVFRASFSFIDSDEQERPIWIEMNEVYISEPVEDEPFSKGTKMYLPDMKMADLWVNRPSDVIIIDNAQTDPNIDKKLQANIKKIGNKTMIFIPLHVRGRWLGLIRLAWKIEKAFSESEIRLLNVISEQASIVTNQIVLFKEARARAEQLETLSEIEFELSQAINENDILKSIQSAIENPTTLSLYHFRNDEFRNPSAFQQVAHWENGAFQEPIRYVIPLTETHPIHNEWQSNPNQIITVENIDEYARMDDEARQSYSGAGIKSLIVLPLINFGRWQGVMEIGWSTLRQFNESELSMLQQLIEPIAANVASKRALTETENLYQVSEKLNEAKSYKDILKIFNQHSPLGLQADLQQIIYFNKSYDETTLPGWFEIVEQQRKDGTVEDAFRPTRHKLSEFVQLDKLNKEEPIILEDLQNSKMMKDIAGPALLGSVNAKSAIGLPLNLANAQLGYIIFYFKEKTRFYSFEIRELYRLIDQSAIAIQGLRFLQLAESRAIREQKIREIAAKVRSSTNVESILRTAAKEVGNALGRHSVVYLESNGSGSNQN